MESSNLGGFVVTKNVRDGKAISFTYREGSRYLGLNGWFLYSVEDDDEYVKNTENFLILDTEAIGYLAPAMLEIYEAPFGTEVSWLYEGGVHKGFYDVKNKQETTVEEILSGKAARESASDG